MPIRNSDRCYKNFRLDLIADAPYFSFCASLEGLRPGAHHWRPKAA
jgi:hypothetical protein